MRRGYNPYAAGGQFGQYQMVQFLKNEKWLKPWHMGTHLRVLRGIRLMNTKMKRFGRFLKIFASLCFGQK